MSNPICYVVIVKEKLDFRILYLKKMANLCIYHTPLFCKWQKSRVICGTKLFTVILFRFFNVLKKLTLGEIIVKGQTNHVQLRTDTPI